jgi:cytochrome c oxidase subunit I+III
LPVLAGLGTAAFFLFLTVKLFIPSAIGAIVALVSIFKWLWESEPAPSGKLYDIGGGVRLPDYMTGSRSHAWWAVVVLMLVDGAIFASLVFSYFYLWTVAPAGWPPSGFDVPASAASLIASGAFIGSSIALRVANRSLDAHASLFALSTALLVALLAIWTGFAFNLHAVWSTDVRPDAHAYGAVSYTFLAWQGLHVALVTLMAGYTAARSWAGLLDPERRSAFDCTRLLWHYTVVQGLFALAVMHAPRLSG